MEYAARTHTRPHPVLAEDTGLDAAWCRLDKAIRIGMIRGVVGLSARDRQSSDREDVLALARELIRQDILVLITGLPADTQPETDLDQVGVGLAEFCSLCGIPAMVSCHGQDTSPLTSLCSRLAEALETETDALPVTADIADSGLSALPIPPDIPLSDTAAVAEAISRDMTVKRLALGLNDRFDGSVYS